MGQIEAGTKTLEFRCQLTRDGLSGAQKRCPMEQSFRSLWGSGEVVFAEKLKAEPNCCLREGCC